MCCAPEDCNKQKKYSNIQAVQIKSLAFFTKVQNI